MIEYLFHFDVNSLTLPKITLSIKLYQLKFKISALNYPITLESRKYSTIMQFLKTNEIKIKIVYKIQDFSTYCKSMYNVSNGIDI